MSDQKPAPTIAVNGVVQDVAVPKVRLRDIRPDLSGDELVRRVREAREAEETAKNPPKEPTK